MAQSSRTYSCKGDSELIDKIDKFLLAVGKLGEWGASRRVSISVDGDGAERLQVKGIPKGTAFDKDGLGKAVEKDEIRADILKLKEEGTMNSRAQKLITQWLEARNKKRI